MVTPSAETWGAAPVRRHGWFVSRGDGWLVHARHWPPRFDCAARGDFPAARAGRLARAVRQDLWRVMRGLRGFSPVVLISQTGEGLSICAGGRVMGGHRYDGLEADIGALLSAPRHRDRWLSWAQTGRDGT